VQPAAVLLHRQRQLLGDLRGDRGDGRAGVHQEEPRHAVPEVRLDVDALAVLVGPVQRLHGDVRPDDAVDACPAVRRAPAEEGAGEEQWVDHSNTIA
jgi:hypothetical protein